MRILYLHQYFVPPEGSGGTRSYEFARRLVERGHHVTMVTSSAMMPARSKSGPAARYRLRGIDLVVLPVDYDNAMTHAERLRAFARFATRASFHAVKHRADVVFATSTPLTIALPALATRLTRRIPMVFEVRDLWPELPIAMGALRSPWSRHAAHALEWTAYHASARVVALSPGIADGIARRGIPRERISVIPNACDLQLFSPPPDRVDAFARSQLPWLAPGAPLIVYAGTLGAINGVEWLVEVAAAMRSTHPEVRFAIVGKGARHPNVEALARTRGVLGRNLWMLPPLAKETVPLLLARAQIATSLFLPIEAMHNNSANKFFDALASGTPVAINYGGWQAELLRHSGAGLVLPPNDPAEAAAMLGDWVATPARLESAAAAALKLARTRFDRDALAERLEQVLLDAARDSARHRAA